MADPMVRPRSPGWRFALLWVLATAVGALLGPAFAFPVNLALVALLGVTGPVPGTTVDQALILTADGMGATMLFVGLGMGFCQWLLLRRYLKHSAAWILATGLAMLLAGVFRMSLPPDTPASLIGPLTVPAGAISLAVCQWFVLRARVPQAWRWIVICLAGWAPTLVLSLIGDSLFASTGNSMVASELIILMILIATFTILPLAVAAAGMVWLLRQTPRASQAIAS